MFLLQFVVAQDQKALQYAISKCNTFEIGLEYRKAIETLKSLNATELLHAVKTSIVVL